MAQWSDIVQFMTKRPQPWTAWGGRSNADEVDVGHVVDDVGPRRNQSRAYRNRDCREKNKWRPSVPKTMNNIVFVRSGTDKFRMKRQVCKQAGLDQKRHCSLD